MQIKSRLHLQCHSEPHARAYIVGEPQALRALGETLIRASRSLVGLETLDLYASDGHRYTVMVASAVSEDEWQQLPPPYSQNHDPTTLSIVQAYDEIAGVTQR